VAARRERASLPTVTLLGEMFPALMQPTLPGIAAAFSQQELAFLAWVHFLAFDLFVGRWVYLDGREKGRSVWLMAPILVLTLMMGPLEVLIPFLVKDELGGGPSDHALVLAGFGIGGALGSLVMASVQMPRRYLTLMNLGWGVACLPFLVIGMTSLLLIIGYPELTYYANNIQSNTFLVFEAFTALAVIYLAIVWTLSALIRFLERRLALPEAL